MAISEKDIKKLWGKAAGRCSAPGCEINCIELLSGNDPTVLGDMAHIIAQSPLGPRGEKQAGENTYENLILLCPIHHKKIDKAPSGTFSVETIQEWKLNHENAVHAALDAPRFEDRIELFIFIQRLLIENYEAWKSYGPDGIVAKNNPFSSLFSVWSIRKLCLIVPNNRRIINILKRNKILMDSSEYGVACAFIEHAEGFEQSCYEPLENVPKFPKTFKRLIENGHNSKLTNSRT
jgi:hypothetical protein